MSDKGKCPRSDCDGVILSVKINPPHNLGCECSNSHNHCDFPGCDGVWILRVHGYTVPADWICTKVNQHGEPAPALAPEVLSAKERFVILFDSGMGYPKLSDSQRSARQADDILRMEVTIKANEEAREKAEAERDRLYGIIQRLEEYSGKLHGTLRHLAFRATHSSHGWQNSCAVCGAKWQGKGLVWEGEHNTGTDGRPCVAEINKEGKKYAPPTDAEVDRDQLQAEIKSIYQGIESGRLISDETQNTIKNLSRALQAEKERADKAERHYLDLEISADKEQIRRDNLHTDRMAKVVQKTVTVREERDQAQADYAALRERARKLIGDIVVLAGEMPEMNSVHELNDLLASPHPGADLIEKAKKHDEMVAKEIPVYRYMGMEELVEELQERVKVLEATTQNLKDALRRYCVSRSTGDAPMPSNADSVPVLRCFECYGVWGTKAQEQKEHDNCICVSPELTEGEPSHE